MPSALTSVIHEHTVTLYGAVGRLMDLLLAGSPRQPCPDEILAEGPAGTGKTFGICVLLILLCEEFAGIKVLVARKTLTSMRDTVLVTLEAAFPPGHPAIARSHLRDGRPQYAFPNKSLITTASFESVQAVEKIKSGEYDVFYANEATDLTLNDWEIATTRLRNGKLPLGQPAIADCNPVQPTHWLNKRPERRNPVTGGPQMLRLLSRHEDNPRYYRPGTRELTGEGEKYLAKLDALSGVRYQRLRLGKWVAAEGQVWENFDAHQHVLYEFPAWLQRDADGDPLWHLTIATVDWGFRKAGVIQVWRVDREGRMFCVHEIYRAGVHVILRDRSDHDPCWVDWALKVHAQYGVKQWVCDPAEPEFIAHFRNVGLPATAADNELLAGLDAVRSRLAPDRLNDGRPRLFFMADRLRERCPICDENNWPCGAVEEIPEYVYPKAEDGRLVREEPDPKCQDHGCDTTRYAARYVDRVFEPPKPRQPRRRDTLGYILGHPKEHYS